MGENGLLGDLTGWLSHPVYSGGNTADWLIGLTVVVIIAFLWSTVIRTIQG